MADFDDATQTGSDDSFLGGVSDTAQSFADSASSAWNNVSDGASSAWNTVSDSAQSAFSSLSNPFSGPKQDDGPISVPMQESTPEEKAASEQAAQYEQDHWDEIQAQKDRDYQQRSMQEAADNADKDFKSKHYGIGQEQWNKNDADCKAQDAGFQNSQHMQDYIQARKDYEGARDKWTSMSDDDRAKQPFPGMDKYMQDRGIAPKGRPAY
jgi:hypothetical protein